MSIFFNGVMASREAGFLLPSSVITRAKVCDCTINALKLDSGAQDIRKDEGGVVQKKEIVSDPNNLPLDPTYSWSMNTVLFANFNNNLEAGQIALNGEEIDSLIIRRCSNRNNFIYWEDIYTINDVEGVVNNYTDFTFSDKTVESGIWYNYGIQPVSKNVRGNLLKGPREAVIYEDGFLVGEGGRQLKLRFNTSVGSFKKNIKESKVETIGGKYPFITRNANVNYREFSLSGIITQFMDKTEEFAPRAELFIDEEFADGDVLDMTSAYNDLYANYGIGPMSNTVVEREFRKKVEEFLQDGKPKLFKSPTEGNLLVRIMDVSLSPNQTLGRLICDFSCSVVEVGEASLDNFDKYGIQVR